MTVPPADREPYQPGPEYERLESGQMAAEPSGGQDTWLLQLPHYWSTKVATELQLRGGGDKGVTGRCNDDEGTSYAVELDTCPAGQPVYAFTLHGGRAQLQSCGRRATWIRSEAVLASHEAANKPKAKQKPAAAEPAAKQTPTAAVPVQQGQAQKVKKHKARKDKDKKKEKAKVKKKHKVLEQA